MASRIRRTRPNSRATVFLCLTVLLFATLACQTPAQHAAPAPVAPPPSVFQRHLDALGVPLTLPARGKAVLVNIPAFELIAFEDAEPVLGSRVIVGTPWNRAPRLATYVTAVRFRPTWRPTPVMVRSGD